MRESPTECKITGGATGKFLLQVILPEDLETEEEVAQAIAAFERRVSLRSGTKAGN